MSAQTPDGFPPNPSDYPQQPPKKSNTLLWVLGIVGVVLIGGGLLCCGGLYFAGRFGMDMASQQVQAQIADDPVVMEHIGQVEEVSLDLMATSERGQSGVVVFQIHGDKSDGLLIGRQGPGGRLTDMELEMPDGQTYPLSDAPAPSPDAAEESVEAEDEAAPPAA